jgi:hypothetical protein
MALIDVSVLDTDKTYVCMEFGIGFIAKTLQDIQHKVYHDTLPKNLPSHIFAIANNTIYECHASWSGVRKYSIDEYNKNNKNPISIYEYPLNINRLDYYVKFNPGYSFTQLADDVADRLMGLKIPAAVGMVCSEFIAACSENYDICHKMNIPYSLIVPADFQEYFKDKEPLNGTNIK